MTVSSTTTKNSYNGNGVLTVFAYGFKVFDEDDIEVILRNDTTGTETVQTITTNYSVSNVGNASGGNVTFVTAPASGITIVLRRASPLTQTTDYTPNDPFPAESHEDALDKLTFISQQLQEEVDRSIKLSRTNTMTSTEFTVGAADRANKILAFDGDGEINVAQELGVFKGNWSSGTAFVARDIVKDTSTNNIFIANTAHTSSGSEPLTTNTDSAKWDLIVDAASATTSATNASNSATAAATDADDANKIVNNNFEVQYTLSNGNTGFSALHYYNATLIQTQNAVTQAGLATTAKTDAQAAKTDAEAAQTAAEAALDLFDDAMLGAKASDPSLDNDGQALADGALYFDTTNDVMKVYNLATTSWLQLTPTVSNQTNINTVAGIESDVTTVAGIDSDITTVAGINTTHLSNVSGVATEVGLLGTADAVADMNTLGTAAIVTDMDTLADRATDIATLADIEDGTTATNAIQTVAANVSGVTSFAEVYRSGATDPTTGLDEGDLFFNTTSDTLKVYNGTTWEAGVTAGSGFLPLSGGQLTGNLTFSGSETVDGRDVSADGTKLDGIEAGATADQTGAEIKSAYEGEADTNAFTDAEKTKLTGIETSADVTDTTNVTAAGALMDSEVTNLAQVKAFDSADYATAAQGTLADNALPKSGGTMTGTLTLGNNTINDVEDIYLRDKLYHDADTDTYLGFGTNQINLVTGGSTGLILYQNYLQAYENVVGSVHLDTNQGTGTHYPDFQNYNSFVWTLTGNITLGNPSTEIAGMSGVFIFTHSGAGRTVSPQNQYETIDGGALTLSGTAGAVDIVPYFVRSTSNIMLGKPLLNFVNAS